MGPRVTAFFIATALALPAMAAQQRVALLVAHPLGGQDLMPLRYTANDLDRMHEVLRDIGDFTHDDILVSFGEDADDVVALFDAARARLGNGDDTLFVFYYSGHAKDGDLRLGDTRLSLVELKRLIEGTGAGLRVALLDSCRSGSITRLKGAIKGDAVAMAVEDSAAQAGQVLITASSANEDAQESDDIQGSFFTHYVTSALRGAGDENHDGNITLSEAYAFAYAHTVARTVGTRGGIQHPTYRFDLRGAGDVVLTRPGQPTSAIHFPAALAGHFVVFDMGRKVVVAEFDKETGASARLAVAPGSYVVKKRETDHLEMQRLQIVEKSEARVDPDEMEHVAFEDDYAKGATVSVDQVLYGKLGMRLSAGLGAQAFLSTPARNGYFPNLGFLALALDIDNALRRGMGIRFDVGLGGSGEHSLVLDDPYLGELSYQVAVSQVTFGMALTGAWDLHERISLGGHARLGLISVNRKFVGGELPNQGFSTLTPGLGLDATFRLFSWLEAGLRARLHYMFFNVDESMSLMYLDGGVVLTAVLQ